MEILIAEDDEDILLTYKSILKGRKHYVKIAKNGIACLDIYHRQFEKIRNSHDSLTNHVLPFDVVLLDYKMPKMNGLEVAREILSINERQRIVFASAYVKETLEESVKQLNHVVELLQKPFSNDTLIRTIENHDIYEQLQRFNISLKCIEQANFRRDQLQEITRIVKDIYQK